MVVDGMGQEISKSSLKSCVEFIEERRGTFALEDTPYVFHPGEEVFGITPDRIFPVPDAREPRNVGFVDGGCAPLLTSADFSISLGRVAGCVFRGSNYMSLKATPEVVEFHTATVLVPTKSGVMTYETRFFPREADHERFLPTGAIVFSVNDQSIRRGRFLPHIHQFGSIAMRFAEWAYTIPFIASELGDGDIVVRDGSLQASYTSESILTRALADQAQSLGVFLTGLSKTCSLFTQNGHSIASAVNAVASQKLPTDSWYFYPLSRITRGDSLAELYFVKLHKLSLYPFRFDIALNQSQRLSDAERGDLIASVAATAADLSFPGYPYGLIKVDQLSRVSGREVMPQQYDLIANFDPDIYERSIAPRVRSVDAHDTLNQIGR